MIIFAWRCFPQYAARCVGAFVRATTERVVVVATRPRVPVEGMERLAGCSVLWVDGADVARDVYGEMQQICPFESSQTTLIVSGWSEGAFNKLREQICSQGGRAFCMNDACFAQLHRDHSILLISGFKAYLRRCVQAVRFRLLFKKKFRGFFVPGKSGRRLMRFYGVSEDRIAEGMYSADETLFHAGADITRRPKQIVYVGQFCDRKNVLAVTEAFVASGIDASGWRLALYGCGPQRNQLPVDISSITIHDFLQPEQLADVYRQSRAFILASKEEHWGLVVHEAALSGCYLLLSNRVGAVDDLLGRQNGTLFDPFDVESITDAFRQLALQSDEDLQSAQRESLRLAGARGCSTFVAGVKQLLRMEGDR